MDGASTIVLSIIPAKEEITGPQLFNMKGKAKLAGTTLYLENVSAEMGSSVNWKVALAEAKKLAKVFINGKESRFAQTGKLVTGSLAFTGRSFSPMQQVGKFDPLFSGGTFTSSFIIPEWIFKQLQQRKKDWPIPWSKDDYKTTWLVPERLLLYIQVAEPEDTMQVNLRLMVNLLN